MTAYNDCDDEVEVDNNLISMLMQLLLNKNGGQNANENTQNSAPNASNFGKNATNDQTHKASAFALENGLGDKIKLDDNFDTSQNTFEEMMRGFANQNPIFQLLGAMKSGKCDMSTLLPLLSTLMQKNNTAQNACEKRKENNDKSTQNSLKNDENNAKNQQKNNEKASKNDEFHSENQCDYNEKTYDFCNEKTQPSLFAPIAFSGYQVACALCALLKNFNRD